MDKQAVKYILFTFFLVYDGNAHIPPGTRVHAHNLTHHSHLHHKSTLSTLAFPSCASYDRPPSGAWEQQ